ncbi:hypothetical protein CONLIGDRAFT_428804 [Coniochaeta ligniaria NRRL 30616]|uniref:Uncharacterized protein n=1 Tax=Coniochaeta ligniaria NRRL 30616 TaxID=1408157 RepID=A0A1J7J276_9PEZI|nr:hypothetical protein CONLIGDRAFT_428804 [Coniochaeta ligniaria NRRL 30616]
MASQNWTDPIQRFLNDGDLGFAHLHLGSPSTPYSTPRRHQSAGLGSLFGTTDAAVYVPLNDPEYAISSAGSRASTIYADDDAYHQPADFMHIPSRARVASQVDGSAGRSGYRASPAVYHAPSTHSSEASSFAPSIFTRASAKTSVGASSRPPPQAHITNFNAALAAAAAADYASVDDTRPIAPVPTSHPLWCELCVMDNCSATFRIDQTREWIDHHCRHLKDRYPDRLMCWFCDHVPFVTSGRTNGERYANFYDRMEHIREHISGEYRTSDQMRPDFSMIDYLADNRIIDDRMRRTALGYTEVPEALRFPGSSASGSTQSYEQPQRRPPGPPLAYDLDGERRRQRPRGGHRHHHYPASSSLMVDATRSH